MSVIVRVSDRIKNASERNCYISFLPSKDRSNFHWPTFLSLTRDRSRSLLVSESGDSIYRGKKVPMISMCRSARGSAYTRDYCWTHTCAEPCTAAGPEWIEVASLSWGQQCSWCSGINLRHENQPIMGERRQLVWEGVSRPEFLTFKSALWRLSHIM